MCSFGRTLNLFAPDEDLICVDLILLGRMP